MTRALAAGLAGLLLMALPAQAGTAPATLPFAQGWVDTGLISADDDWSGVIGIVGYRGDGLAGEPGSDPRGVSADGSGTPADVTANLTDPRAVGLAAGVAEFELADPVVAIQGSATASAPHLVLSLDTSGRVGVSVRMLLRDIDASAHDAVEPVALQYRVGSSGPFAGVPGGYVADATSGPSEATRVSRLSVNLPAAADDQPVVQVRVLTTNAVGQDEWVGIDDIEVSAGGGGSGCSEQPAPGPGHEPAEEHTARTHRLGVDSRHLHACEARPRDRAPRARRNRAALPPVTRGAGAIRSGPRRRRTGGLRTEARQRPLRAEGVGEACAVHRRALQRPRSARAQPAPVQRPRARPAAGPGRVRPPGCCGRPRRAEIRGRCGPLRIGGED